MKKWCKARIYIFHKLQRVIQKGFELQKQLNFHFFNFDTIHLNNKDNHIKNGYSIMVTTIIGKTTL